MPKQKKVMVTGAAGFIGSHLVETLLEKGYAVHAFDREPLARAHNLTLCAKHPSLIYHEGDIRNPTDIAAFYQPDAEVLFHLASIVGVTHYLANPLDLIDIIVGGTRQLFALANEHRTRIVFTSTSEIYGKNPNIPWDESANRVLGSAKINRWSYSSSKAVCEHMLFGLYHHNQLPFSIVRFFNVYGPKQAPRYIISQSIQRALQGKKPYCYDDGTQTRCFTYIDDAVDALMRISQSERAIGEDFNIGNPTETSIRSAIEMIVENMDHPIEMEMLNTKKEFGQIYEDIPRRIPKTTKAKSLLDWEATTSLRDGILKTISWAKENPWWLNEKT